MLAPKRIKFRKQFKGKTRGIATRGNAVSFGEFALMSMIVKVRHLVEVRPAGEDK